MARPAYVVYLVKSMTGSPFSDQDLPEVLEYAGSCEAINGNDARKLVMGDDASPVLVLRMNTVVQFALKMPDQS